MRSPPVHRLFFALFPDADVRDRIARQAQALRLRQPSPQGRWVAPDRYHLTLRFLGQFEDLDAEMVARASRAAANVSAPLLRLRLDHLACFDGRRPPWVLRCSAADDGLLSLWEGLGRALASVGLAPAPEPAFAPHVTLFYSEGERIGAEPVPAIDWVPGDYVLAHSVLGDPSYRLLGRWRLPA